MKSIYVGVDISKGSLDFCVRSSGSETFHKIGNETKSIRKLLKAISKSDPQAFIAMENTGHYNFNLYQALEGFGFKAYVIDPKHIKRSIGLVRGKNDKVDAKRIAVFIERNHHDLDCWQPISKTVKSLKILLAQRRFKVKQRKALKQQIADLKAVAFNKSTQKLIKINLKNIKEINKHVTEIEALIREEVNSDPKLKKDIVRIKSIPGVGDITAWTIAIKTEGFQRLMNPRKLACFSGVAPFEQQSGSSLKTRPRVSKMADLQLKSTLQMAAMRAVRMKNDLQNYYLRKVEEGKNKMSVLNAVRNKIIHIAMALIKNKTYYQNRLVLS
ncbi:IS110 family transposase [Galbibacter sp. EGI 63066]|uniref:IS110 family transposase n=1 Tax=Galbibacter sp. EGI 63066 TaxID=2993559 RepID=UPI002249338F|nr:IS110 family transposase [Galbibacter sp. EGI 63066]MCX2680033.1 IS110 family transposase [Galbibacter sp. EGI 63066]